MEELPKMKPVKGYEGKYSITEDGQVWSHLTNKFMTQQLKKGYYCVHLSFNGSNAYRQVHRLVALTYVPNPDPERFNIVNHKDENPLNNHYTNLEWCDVAYNTNFGTRNQRVKESNQNTLKQGYTVRCIETGKIYQSIREASRQTGIDAGNIRRVCGKNGTAGKLHWEYLEKRNVKAKPRPVRCITTDTIYENASQAEKATGTPSSNILKACKGLRQTANGMKWEFIEINE